MIPTLVWTLPRVRADKYRGGFPLFFEQNLQQLLGYPDRILQPFGGRAELGMRVDIDPLVEPDLLADAHQLPLEDETFDCVILDPPYSDGEALQLYGTTRKLEPGKYIGEAVRVLKPGGWLVIYTDRESKRPARCNNALRIVIVLRQPHRARVANVFQKRKPSMPMYGSEPGELVDVTEQAA